MTVKDLCVTMTVAVEVIRHDQCVDVGFDFVGTWSLTRQAQLTVNGDEMTYVRGSLRHGQSRVSGKATRR
jgi:hypothetical protein